MIIYKATCLINNKVYIGKTIVSLEQRKKTHFKKQSHTRFSRAIHKYGQENFKWEVIEICSTHNRLNKREIYWINFYNSTNKQIGYNITKGGGLIGYHHKQSSKDLISLKNSFKKQKKEQCIYCSTITTVSNIAKYHNANCKQNPNITDEQLKRRKHSKQHCINIGNANRGSKRIYKKLICPHCGVEMFSNVIKQYHFDKCKKIAA